MPNYSITSKDRLLIPVTIYCTLLSMEKKGAYGFLRKGKGRSKIVVYFALFFNFIKDEVFIFYYPVQRVGSNPPNLQKLLVVLFFKILKNNGMVRIKASFFSFYVIFSFCWSKLAFILRGENYSKSTSLSW